MNAVKLREEIEDAGLRQDEIAEEMGLTAASLQSKLDGKSGFTFSEAARLQSLLNIPVERTIEIFFAV